MANQIFVDLVRSIGDLAGIFEYDGKAGYFYLYRTNGTDCAKVVDAIHIVSGEIDFAHNDVTIQWDDSETKVALSIRSTIWAVFDCASGQKFGGSYGSGESPVIPNGIRFTGFLH